MTGISFSGFSETFYGETKTGLIELKEFGYPVFLYVPEGVKPGRRYPLIVAIPEEGQSPKANIEKWTTAANRRTMLVLSPMYERIDDMPYSYDRWLLELKDLVELQYPVNSQKIFLIGLKSSTPYVGYLATNYPEEFSAAGMIEGTWMGRFEKIYRFKKNPVEQVPFGLFLKENQQELIEHATKKAYQFEKRKYLVEIQKFPDSQDFSKYDFQKQVLSWLDEKSDSWQAVVAESQKTTKEKVRKAIKDFFIAQ